MQPSESSDFSLNKGEIVDIGVHFGSPKLRQFHGLQKFNLCIFASPTDTDHESSAQVACGIPSLTFRQVPGHPSHDLAFASWPSTAHLYTCCSHYGRSQVAAWVPHIFTRMQSLPQAWMLINALAQSCCIALIAMSKIIVVLLISCVPYYLYWLLVGVFIIRLIPGLDRRPA